MSVLRKGHFKQKVRQGKGPAVDTSLACARSSKEALSLGAAGSIPALHNTLSRTGKMLAEGFRAGGRLSLRGLHPAFWMSHCYTSRPRRWAVRLESCGPSDTRDIPVCFTEACKPPGVDRLQGWPEFFPSFSAHACCSVTQQFLPLENSAYFPPSSMWTGLVTVLASSL